MKKNYSLVLLIIALAAFTSCQKEIVLNNPSTDSTSGGGVVIPPSTNGDLVIKVYGRAPTGLDSNVTNYTYNSNKKLISRRIKIFAYGASNDTWSWYERNSAGLIVKSKQYQVSSTSPFPSDTSVTVHHYTAGVNQMLQSSVTSSSFFGIVITDSIVFTYNSSGKAIKSENFQSGVFSATPQLASRVLYFYDAADNPSKIESYSIASGVATLETTVSYTYDNKNEPLKYSDAESLVISEVPSPKNNALTFKLISATTGGTNANTNYTYTYNSANKPATSVVNTVLTGPLAQTTITNFTIYYQ